MKKILILVLIPILFVSLNIKSSEDLLRIRIIANSNSEEDQNIKNEISYKVRKYLYSILKDETDIENARKKIKDNMHNIDNIIKEEDLSYSYNINYGLNYFPKKEYDGKIYEEGNYESLLITLGEGKGNNWWCILFPPLCLIEAEENETIEYDFFISKILKNLFN